MTFKWKSIGPGQPMMCTLGSVKYYKFEDGHASCSVHDCYVSALFETPEAAKSWSGHWDEAEAEFKRLNAPTGHGEKMLSPRTASALMEYEG